MKDIPYYIENARNLLFEVKLRGTMWVVKVSKPKNDTPEELIIGQNYERKIALQNAMNHLHEKLEALCNGLNLGQVQATSHKMTFAMIREISKILKNCDSCNTNELQFEKAS